LEDIAQHRLDEIAEFFATSKRLEKKETQILGWKGLAETEAVIASSIAACQQPK
jgi:inorganic pyrophosphatase